jgi:hypothetical protein
MVERGARDPSGGREGAARSGITMNTVEHVDISDRPRVTGPLPGPRSAELPARQDRRESNARVYPRHIPIAIDEASGTFVRDLDGNVFIDFLTGAGELSLGENHPELTFEEQCVRMREAGLTDHLGGRPIPPCTVGRNPHFRTT